VTSTAADLLPAFFEGDARAEKAAWVWRLAACEQGLPCGTGAPFMLDDCRRRNSCIDGETQLDYIRRVSGDPPSLMARARQLSLALRKGEIDGQAFDETVTMLGAPGPRTLQPESPSAKLLR